MKGNKYLREPLTASLSNTTARVFSPTYRLPRIDICEFDVRRAHDTTPLQYDQQQQRTDKPTIKQTDVEVNSYYLK